MKKDYLITVYSGSFLEESKPVFEERLSKVGNKFKNGYLKAIERIYKKDSGYGSENTIYCNEIK